MRTFYKIYFLFLLLCIAAGSYCQIISSDSLQKQFNNYNSRVLQEKIFVHTDKTFYIPGEIIWFKIYDVDASSLKLLNVSKVGYVEIISRNKKPLLQAKIELKEGTGNGSFSIPSTINTGNYTLRVYTNWMKNFDADFYFEKNITIVNPVKNTVDAEKDSLKYDVQFFPEGGNLVYGITSKVAFKAMNNKGQSVNCSGAVVDVNNDTVVKFKSFLFGMGHFLFQPKEGLTYKAVIEVEKGKKIPLSLPPVSTGGFVMQVQNINEDNIKLTVTAKGKGAYGSIFFIAQTRNEINTGLEKELNNGIAEIEIPKNILGEGISTFTIFNEQRQPVCERLYFKRPVQKPLLEINNATTETERRKKVDLLLQAKTVADSLSQADLSLSVFLLDSLQTLEEQNITNYLYFTSELKGNIESPGFYFQNPTTETGEALENLMLTQGWRRFSWNDIVQDKKPVFKFVPEFEGHIIKGIVEDKITNAPVASIPAYLTIPGYRYQFYNSLSNANGEVRFNVKDFYGLSDIIVQANNKTNTGFRVNISSPWSDKFSDKVVPAFNIPQQRKQQLAQHYISSQVQSNFIDEKKQQFILPALEDSTAFYGKPDKKYFLDDYTRFYTMEEVMREYVPEVRVRKQREDFYYRVEDKLHKLYFEDDPLVLLDGVPVFNTNNIVAFDPLKIKKMEIVTRKFYSGASINNGIVSYSTYEGDLAGYQLNPNATILEYEGLQVQREFYTPVYETTSQQQSRTPDYRNVLYWSPAIKLTGNNKKQISFYTSDIPGKYQVVVQGITTNGLPVFATSTFTVSGK